MSLKIRFVNGKLAEHIRADAIVVPATSKGPWDEGLHKQVREASSSYYYHILERLTYRHGRGLKDGTFIVSHGDARHNKHGGFNDVIFMVDDGPVRFEQMLSRLLLLIYSMKYECVGIPPLRLQDSLNPSLMAYVIAKEVLAFKRKFSDSTTSLYFVIDNDPQLQDYLETAFTTLS